MDPTNLEYQVDDRTFAAYLAHAARPEASAKSHVGVLVFPDAAGLGERPKERARRLAAHGFTALAVDLFGEAIHDRAHALATIEDLLGDRAKLRRRVNAAHQLLLHQVGVDASRTAAIGFCFGGAAALELARSGAEVACVVGFHSTLSTKDPGDAKQIRGRVLAIIGARDPIVPEPQRQAFIAEMSNAKVDWQLHLHDAVHAFTSRDADAMNHPALAYDERTDKRSWRAMLNLFEETFGDTSSAS
jgi:dienelactone hydrolase